MNNKDRMVLWLKKLREKDKKIEELREDGRVFMNRIMELEEMNENLSRSVEYYVEYVKGLKRGMRDE
jgi:uncharacterized protein (UPF0128 family)